MRIRKRGRVWYATVYVDGQAIERSTKCHDRRAAEAVAAGWERDTADPDYTRKTSATLDDILARHRKHVAELVTAGKRSADTLAFYEIKHGQLARYFEPEQPDGSFTPFPLFKLNAHAVDSYISHRRSEETSEYTIQKELVSLRAALKQAKRAGLWSGDIEELIPPGFSPEYTPRERALSVDETGKLLAELLPYQAARVAFICATGANWRESELASCNDITNAREVPLHGTKTKYRKRVVPIVFPEQRELLKHTATHGEKEGMLFKRWQNVARDLTAACRRAKIERCTPNDLRRTFAHLMRNKGAPNDLIAPAMGHADTRMVERVYGKLTPAELRRLIEKSAGLKTTKGLSDCRNTASDSADAARSDGQMRQKTAKKMKENVPRGGIEPPTRGFSVLLQLDPTPRKAKRNRDDRRRDAAILPHVMLTGGLTAAAEAETQATVVLEASDWERAACRSCGKEVMLLAGESAGRCARCGGELGEAVGVVS
jgi:integrase